MLKPVETLFKELSDWSVTMPEPDLPQDICQLQAGPLNPIMDTGIWKCALSTKHATQSASLVRRDVTIPEIEWSPGSEVGFSDSSMSLIRGMKTLLGPKGY